MKNLYIAFILLFSISATAQVGINNTDPKAQLDITAGNTPSEKDGLLIPRLDEFPTGVTDDQDGMLVFITGDGTPNKGFYYYDHDNTTFTAVTGASGGTLDQAYDFGGAGNGNVITATDGAVTITGEDGILVTGTHGSGDAMPFIAGSQMFFNPRKSAFRAGSDIAGNWSDLSIGNYSFAGGRGTFASGENATAFGSGTAAQGNNSFATGLLSIANGNASAAFGGGSALGDYSIAGGISQANGSYSFSMGDQVIAQSFAETSLGTYTTNYTPISTTSFNINDRIFSIGNGANLGSKSNALTIYKSGLMNINDEYNMPLTDGAAGQIMTTDGSGNITFQNPIGDGTGTDNQNLTTPTLSGTTLNLGIEDGTGTSINLAALQDGSGGTLDEAYDFGGAGNGNTITATDGAVTIAGEDGFLVKGTFGSGDAITSVGFGSRMFFNPNKAAFRAGNAINDRWDDANVGIYSFATGGGTVASGNYAIAMGQNTEATFENATAIGRTTLATGFASTAMGGFTEASGHYSIAMGRSNDAIGNNSTAMGAFTEATGTASTAMGNATNATGNSSTAMGLRTEALSYAEASIGMYNTLYTPISSTNFNINDRIFSIGNGANLGSKSNALTVYKSGLMNINDEYNMPLTDGSAGQIMTTDGSGNVTFQNVVGDGTGTDNQNLTTPTLSGTTLNLGIEDGTGTSINLAALQDGTGTDNQNLTTPTLSGTTLNLGIEDGTGTSINLAAIGGDITGVNAGAGLVGGATSGNATLNASANNGLTVNAGADNIQLGGALIQDTEVTFGTRDIRWNLDSTGDFIVQDNGVDKFEVSSNSNIFIGGNTAWRVGSTAGTTIAVMESTANAATLSLLNNGSTTTRFRANGDSYFTGGDVGIGTNSPSYKLDVRDVQESDYIAQIHNMSTGADTDGLKIMIGRITAPTDSNRFVAFHNGIGGLGTVRGYIEGNGFGISYSTISDRRLKTNITDIENALELLSEIQPRIYEYKENLGTQEYGFIAQELQPLYPQAVSGTPDSNVTIRPMMVDYGKLTPLLAAGVKELSQKVSTLEDENAALKSQLSEVEKLKAQLIKYETLEARLSALENGLTNVGNENTINPEASGPKEK